VEEGRLADVEHFCYLINVLDCEAGLERTVSRSSTVELKKGV
jgi:hypothetical protein